VLLPDMLWRCLLLVCPHRLLSPSARLVPRRQAPQVRVACSGGVVHLIQASASHQPTSSHHVSEIHGEGPEASAPAPRVATHRKARYGLAARLEAIRPGCRR